MRTCRANPLLEEKIKTPAVLKKIISSWKNKGKKIVFTNGCFDLLHYGHVKYLQEAKKKGDILVVAINSDASVKRIKGRNRPIVKQNERMKIVAALESVDYVTWFGEDTPSRVITILKPDILIKGADWSRNNIIGKNFVLSYGGKVSTLRFVKGLSTTNLLKKIAQKF